MLIPSSFVICFGSGGILQLVTQCSRLVALRLRVVAGFGVESFYIESCDTDAEDAPVDEREDHIDNPGTTIGTQFYMLRRIFSLIRCGVRLLVRSSKCL